MNKQWPGFDPSRPYQSIPEATAKLLREAQEQPELLDQIRAGVTREMELALTADVNPALMHSVTQSYLLLQLIEKLDIIGANIRAVRDFIDAE